MYKLLLFLLILGICSCNNRPAANDANDLEEALDVPPTAQATVKPALLTLLEGRWQSTEDDKNIIEIKGSNFINYYNGNEVSKEELRVFEQCQGACATGQDLGDTACFMTKTAQDSSCYVLVSLDENTLKYALLGGTGNTLEFSRVK